MDYKVILVTPAGRQYTLSILLRYLLKQRESFDEWHLWANTRSDSDLDYIKSLEDKYDFIKVIHRESIPNRFKRTNTGICYFWDYVNDEDSIYVRFDDDIVYMEGDYIDTLVNFRIEHPQYSYVSGNVVNNGICDHINYRMGTLKSNHFVHYACYERTHQNSPYVLGLHDQFIDRMESGTTQEMKSFDRWELSQYERIPINSVCWFGRDWADHGVSLLTGKLDNSKEESYFTTVFPRSLRKLAAICGQALCTHLSYKAQHKRMSVELDGLRKKYSNLAGPFPE